jgi:signal transduction histidine kinase
VPEHIPHTAPDGSGPKIPEAAGNGELTFPDLPRLELDQLLAQLVERAQEVMATQGRLRGLLRANQMITGGLGLATVLHRITVAARDLVGARYAALGVLAPDGGLAEFVHSGMDAADVERIGYLPVGKGLLGALIDHPVPIRLADLADDPRSCGFPPGHPPMTGFLGVPIRIRDEVFGNLYLTESTRGQFTVEDEELVTALAATAAAVIDNARLYETARARGEWLQATATIIRLLLTTDLPDPIEPLRLIAGRVRDVARADLVTVILPQPSPGTGGETDLRVAVAVGNAADLVQGLPAPLSGSVSGHVFRSGEALRLATPDERPTVPSAVPPGLDAGPVLAVPLRGSDRVHGVLTAVRLRGRPVFTAEDLEMATGFANQAAVALELAQARADRQRAALFDDRERIAADLHDHVIQRLFATGLSLQALAATLGSGPTTDRVLHSVADLDTTIGQIRTTIFQLQQPVQSASGGLRARLLDLVADLAPALGHDPTVRFTGLLDILPDPVADDLLAVVREALTNTARHAHATATDIDLTARPDRLTVDIRDNGGGLGETTRRSGLANMRRRAEHHHGTFTVAPNYPTGTHLTWSVPLD